MELLGIHHLTAITADISRNHTFYTQTLGMRLVKKSVNQDDVSAYHLFYADGKAAPGTDVTFFDWPMTRERRGTHSIVRTGLRVGSKSALNWWAGHFKSKEVTHGEVIERDGRNVLDFEDPEGQRLTLVDDGGAGDANPWGQSPIPTSEQIRGLGPIVISVPNVAATDVVLSQALGMRRVREYPHPDNASHIVHVYEMGPGGAAAELHVAVQPDLPVARQGAGGVHHVAFRVPTVDEYHAWTERLNTLGIGNSGEIDRYYFRSLYFREPNGILFELATDGPGFATDEPMESLGEKLALPPFLEGQRAAIEANLKPLR